jgi:WD40 repeat protein
VVEDEPLPPRRGRPDIPADLEAICLKCLEKSPARRYQKAEGLRDDLGRFLDGRPVLARPVAPWQRLWRRARRRPAHAALAALTVALVALVVGSADRLAQDDRRLNRVNTELGKANDATRRSEERARVQAAQLAKREAAVRRGKSASARQLADRSLQTGDVELALRHLDDDDPAAQRAGFAGQYLSSLCRRRLVLFQGHRDSVYALAVAPDGRVVATGGLDRSVILWDLASGHALATLVGHTRPVFCVAFSRDGRILASLADDGSGSEIRLWDVATGRAWEGELSAGGLYALSFARDDRELITASRANGRDSLRREPLLAWALDSVRRRLDTRPRPYTGELRHGLAGAPSAEPWDLVQRFGMATLPDGRTLAVRSGQESILLHDLGSGERLAVARTCGGAVRFQAVSDQRAVLRPSDWERANASVGFLAGSPEPCVQTAQAVTSFACSPDGRLVALAGPGWPPTLYDSERRQPVARYQLGNPRIVRAMAFTPHGDSLILAGDTPEVRLWRLRPPEEPLTWVGHPAEVWGLAFSADGRTLASAADDHTVRLWDAATGAERRVQNGHDSLVTDLAFSCDGKTLASGSFDGTVRLWDPADGVCREILQGPAGRVRTVAFSPDGATLASAGTEPMVRLWNPATGRVVGPPLAGHTGKVEALAFSPDGTRLVSGDSEKALLVWDVARRERVAAWEGPVGLLCMAFSPDGRTLVSGHADGSLLSREFPSGQVRSVLHAHSWSVFKVAFDPSGMTLASVGWDGKVKLWDPATGQGLMELTGHEGAVHALAFSADGAAMATGDYRGAIKVWRVHGRQGRE